MKLLFAIALRHIMARKRQSFVSLLGIILGVAFFLAIAALMQGSQDDFMRRLVDNSPHITIEDDYRTPHKQAVNIVYPHGAIEVRHVLPQTETRGVRGYEQVLTRLRAIQGVAASPVLTGQALINFAGQNVSVTLNGMIPSEIASVSTIGDYMIEGSIENLAADADGIIVGAELVKRLSLRLNETLSLATANGQTRTFRIVGIFRTGRGHYDQDQAFVTIKRVQAMMDRANRANSILVKLDDPSGARALAATIEAMIGYKSVSWQESSEDIINTFAIRNAIMYTVVSAVLLVAAFGIYNIISTVVLEKSRDIAILKSMGFRAGEIQIVFLAQGVLLGLAGCALGVPLGMAMMLGLGQVTIKPPGGSELINLPLSWTAQQFMIAIAFAMSASIIAALLPARKASRVMPVDVLRGGF